MLKHNKEKNRELNEYQSTLLLEENNKLTEDSMDEE
jgi:hypothetical protein